MATVRSDGTFGPVSVKITNAIVTVGEKDVKVTGSGSGQKTFSDYWEVSEGAGLTSLYRYGDIGRLEITKQERLEAIEDALEDYYGLIRSFLTLTNDVHTVGAYPRLAVQIIALIASAQILRDKGGNEEYQDLADTKMKEVQRIVDGLMNRSIYMRGTDGEYITPSDSTQYEIRNKTGSFGVVDQYDEEVFDN